MVENPGSGGCVAAGTPQFYPDPVDCDVVGVHTQNPGFGVLCDAVAYRRLVVVTGSGVSVGLAKPGSDPSTLPTWHSVLTQLQDRFAARLGPVAADVDLLLGAQ